MIKFFSKKTNLIFEYQNSLVLRLYCFRKCIDLAFDVLTVRYSRVMICEILIRGGGGGDTIRYSRVMELFFVMKS